MTWAKQHNSSAGMVLGISTTSLKNGWIDSKRGLYRPLLQPYPFRRVSTRIQLHGSPKTLTGKGTPSNIVYRTPSNVHGTPHSNDPDSSRATREATIEFNDSVEDIFSNGVSSDMCRRVNSLIRLIRISYSRSPWIIYTSAKDIAFKGDYSAAREMYDLAYLGYKNSGASRWLVVSVELRIALMRAAEFEGCPQSIAARITQELSRFLMRERQNYIQQPDPIEMRKTLTALKLEAQFWCRVLVQQRALQLWEPILGSEHPKIMQLRGNIADLEARKSVDIGDMGQLEKYETSMNKCVPPGNLTYSPSLEGLLHLEDGSPSDLLKKFEALEESDITGRQLQRELADLRYGRSRSMLGCYYSFLGRYDDAEKAFQDGIRYMKYEVCTEIKLHRIIWYAEHKTRTRDWEDMRNLLIEAHTVFMKNDKPSDFIITHFPHRFKLLCAAASTELPIDRLANEPENSSVFEGLQRETTPASTQQDPGLGRFPSPTQMSSLERLFPLTPRGFNSMISVDAWRQFVEFSPAG